MAEAPGVVSSGFMAELEEESGKRLAMVLMKNTITALLLAPNCLCQNMFRYKPSISSVSVQTYKTNMGEILGAPVWYRPKTLRRSSQYLESEDIQRAWEF